MSDGTRRTMRDMLATRDVKIGHFVGEFVTPGIGYIVKVAGCDYITFDMEHSGINFETIRTALRFAEAAGLATMVRPPSKGYQDIARTLDVGADAIMAQTVATAKEAREIVTCMKYPPQGKRGVTVGHYYDRFAAGPIGPKLTAANQATALFVLIESARGVENADAIAAVDGVDCLYVGHVDLSVDLGIAGENDHPRIVEGVGLVAAACRKHGKSFAWSVGTVGTLEEARRMGADFIDYGGDASLLRDAIAQGVADIRRRVAAMS
jgi:2-keto-3-deoxy-L-rhamnonate aldolase RhmA